LVSLVDCSKELAPEQAGQNLDRQEVFIIALYPGLLIWCQATTCNHTVQMGMEHEILCPSVQDTGQGNLGPQVFWVGCNLLDRFGYRFKEETVHEPLVMVNGRS